MEVIEDPLIPCRLDHTAAVVERVTRRKGCASAALPHPCARERVVSSPPPGAVPSGSGWRGGLPAAAVAVVAWGIEEVAAGLLKSLGVVECCQMPGFGRRSALPILSPGAHPADLDWCHPAGRMAGVLYPSSLLSSSAKSPHHKRFSLANSAPVLVQ